VASLSQGRTAAAQCGLFTYKSVPVIFEPPCMYMCRQWKKCTFCVHGLAMGIPQNKRRIKESMLIEWCRLWFNFIYT